MSALVLRSPHIIAGKRRTNICSGERPRPPLPLRVIAGKRKTNICTCSADSAPCFLWQEAFILRLPFRVVAGNEDNRLESDGSSPFTAMSCVQSNSPSKVCQVQYHARKLHVRYFKQDDCEKVSLRDAVNRVPTRTSGKNQSAASADYSSFSSMLRDHLKSSPSTEGVMTRTSVESKTTRPV